MGTMDLPEQVDVSIDGDSVRVDLGGNITDTSDLTNLTTIQAAKVVIDLENFGRMTSRGVTIWMEMIEELCRHVPEVRIENAPHGFLTQYAMIHGLIAKARIDSIRAGFACDRCGAEKTVSFFRATDFPDGQLDPTKDAPPCDRCKITMVADDLIFEMDVRF